MSYICFHYHPRVLLEMSMNTILFIGSNVAIISGIYNIATAQEAENFVSAGIILAVARLGKILEQKAKKSLEFKSSDSGMIEYVFIKNQKLDEGESKLVY